MLYQLIGFSFAAYGCLQHWIWGTFSIFGFFLTTTTSSHLRPAETQVPANADFRWNTGGIGPHAMVLATGCFCFSQQRLIPEAIWLIWQLDRQWQVNDKVFQWEDTDLPLVDCYFYFKGCRCNFRALVGDTSALADTDFMACCIAVFCMPLLLLLLAVIVVVKSPLPTVPMLLLLWLATMVTVGLFDIGSRHHCCCWNQLIAEVISISCSLLLHLPLCDCLPLMSKNGSRMSATFFKGTFFGLLLQAQRYCIHNFHCAVHNALTFDQHCCLPRCNHKHHDHMLS